MTLGITVDVNANLVKFEEQMNRLGGNLDKFQKHAEGVSNNVDKIFGALGVGVSFAGFAKVSGDVLTTNREMEKLRMQLTALTGSVSGSEHAFDFISKFAVDTPFEIDSLTKAFVTLQNFGIQPTTKVMDAITNQAAKLGGSEETLTGITVALGQAWAKGKLQGDDIMQLVERGVPVWSMLADVTGKSAAELQKMSENGELTKDTIDKLIVRMGELASGSNALAMDTLNGKISNLSDSWHRFEDTLMGDKSEGLIKSFVGSATNAINLMTRNMSQNLDDQIAHAEARIKQFNEMGVIGRFVADFSGYDVNLEKNQIDSLTRQKQKQDDADKNAQVQQNSASAIAQTWEWLGEIESAEAEKSKKILKDRESAAAQLSQRYDDLMANMQREIALRGDNTEAAKMEYEVTHGAFVKLNEAQKIRLLNYAAEKDAINGNIKVYAEYENIIAEGESLAGKQREWMDRYDQLNQKFNGPLLDFKSGIADAMDARAQGIIPNDEELKKVLDKMGRDYNKFTANAEDATGQMSEFAVQAARNMQSGFANFLFDPFANGVGDMGANFVKMLQQMVAQATSAQIFNGLLGKNFGAEGATGGLLGAAFSGIGSLFGGFDGGGVSVAAGNSEAFSSMMNSGGFWSSVPGFASGGNHSGGLRLVGENGPELEYTGPSHIFNADQTRAMLNPQSSSTGDITVTTQVVVNNSNSSNGESTGQALGAVINAKIKQALMDEKRPGGLLA